MEENKEFLSSQILTYLGNKRLLIYSIQEEIEKIKKALNKEKLITADLFAGSGIVSRMMKAHSSHLIVNDLEDYSYCINSCYLSNKKMFNEERFLKTRSAIEEAIQRKPIEGIIAQNYAPQNDEQIKATERVFYTRKNAIKIDSYRHYIDQWVESPEERKYYLAPLLIEASIHTNTSGVFKGFYKDKQTGIGCFGGTGKNALIRILGEIQIPTPLFSHFESDLTLFKEDTLLLADRLREVDLIYLDPPYNQHPYGSNYFMLNLILKNKIDSKISKISGIPKEWNRSPFNRKADALHALETIVQKAQANYFIISYNSEGFIHFDEMIQMLSAYGTLSTKKMNYPTFRGARNLNNRNIHLDEYLFILKK